MTKEKRKIQTMRYSDEELSLTKNTFADNEDLLKAVRKVFLQVPLDVLDKEAIKANITSKPKVMELIRKCYLPEIDPDAPVGQVVDLWMTVDIKDKEPEVAFPHLLARAKLIDYLKQQLEVLKTLDDSGEIRFAELSGIGTKNDVQSWVDNVMRNTLITHNEQQILQLRVLAGTKTETVEQTKERLTRDSSK